MPPTKSINFKRFLTYLSLLLLGGVFLGPLVTYATLTLDSTSITTDDTLKLKGGNVGVGNITPTSNLHVSGTLNVTATSTAAALSVSGASALTGALTLSNPSTNSLIYTNSTGVVTALASSTAGKILTASGTAPYFSWETTGSLTNLTLTGPTTNSPIYLNSAGLIASLASSTAGKVLMATSTAPYFSWETTGSLTNLSLTGPSTNSPIYLNSAGLITALASSTAGKVLMATSTAPYFSWETDATGGTVSTLVADGNNEITVGSTTSALTVNIANAPLSAAQTINIGSGSTGATSTSINIGSGTAANTITLGAGTGGHTINIGTGTTTAKTINIGTANQVKNTITIGNASSSIALSGTLRITEGNQGAGKFLGSDASGGATWQAVDGWTDSGETWTYASVDDPTFTFTISGDKTSKYSAGMRIKLTQTTVKYFIITAVAYADPNTTITVYGGTDYDLANAAISANYYSVVKAPQGFPLDPLKWTVEFRDTSARSKASPVQNTWYNPGSLSSTIPIGSWRVSYNVVVSESVTTQPIAVQFTLSTANNSESDSDFSTQEDITAVNAAFTALQHNVTREKYLLLVSKTTYFLNMRNTAGSGINTLEIRGDVNPTIVRAISAYL